jgi:hypothetical protein
MIHKGDKRMKRHATWWLTHTAIMAMEAVKDIMKDENDFWNIEGDYSSAVSSLKMLLADIEEIEKVLEKTNN